MKKATVVLLSSAAIVIFTVAVCITCFCLYDDNKETESLGNIEIILNDNGKGIDLDQVFPVEDKNIEKVKGYSFEVKNKGSVDTKYRVLLEEVEIKNKKGYKESELLSRNQLNYELTLNGKVIARDSMTKIKNNVIDFRSVPKAKTNKYKLKIWIPASARKTDWSNKYYRYKINIQSVTEEYK